MKMYLRTDLSSVPLGCGVREIRCLPLYCFLWNKREIIYDYPTTQGHGIWGLMVVGTILAGTQEIQEVVERQ